jgi:D-3-phosphoglycerate dehydrogenase
VAERKKVLYLGPDELAAFVGAELGPSYVVSQVRDTQTASVEIVDAAFVLDAFMGVRFDAALLGRGRALEAYVTATTGADHVDAEVLKSRGIPLLTLRGQTEVLRNLTPAAELSWMLVMVCARGARAAVDEVLAGTWNRNRHPGLMLRGRTIGLVGCGRIGSWMTRYALAFGMHVLGYDPHAKSLPDGMRRAELLDLLRESDVVSVHVPLNDETRGLLGRAELAEIKRGAILVNTSRGEIVDESALIEALEDGRLRAVGLDVLTGEPDVSRHALVEYARAHPNVVITPHIGGFSPDAVREVVAFCCKRIRELQST